MAAQASACKARGERWESSSGIIELGSVCCALLVLGKPREPGSLRVTRTRRTPLQISRLFVRSETFLCKTTQFHATPRMLNGFFEWCGIAIFGTRARSSYYLDRSAVLYRRYGFVFATQM